MHSQRRGILIQSIKTYDVSVNNVIIDHISYELESRFYEHGELYADIMCVDTIYFETILSDGLSANYLNKICQLAPQLNKEALREALLSFPA